MPRPRWPLLALLLALASPAAAQVPEYEAKSEFLERFTRFIDWPPGSPAEQPGTPFVIGVVGRDPFGRYLDALATRTIKGKPVRVRRLSGSTDVAACCHLLFISASEARDLPAILARTAERPVLTVGDTQGYGEAGVLINLVSDGGRIGFEVNDGAVRRSGLKFNSKLLRLARIVGTEPAR